MSKKAVVFDMDGVIFDSERLVMECWKVIADKYDIPNIEEACYECMGINAQLTKEKMLARYGQDFPYEAYKAEVSALFHEEAKDGKLAQMPGVKELLSFLKENGYPLALASSTRREVVERELKEGGLYDYFDVIVCGDMVTKSKPDPEIFLLACEKLHVKSENAYAIEDSYNGIRAAYAANMKPIMIPDLAKPTDEMYRISFKIMSSLFEVMDYLKEEQDIANIVEMLDGKIDAKVSRIKVEVSHAQREGTFTEKYHHGRCDVGSVFAKGMHNVGCE